MFVIFSIPHIVGKRLKPYNFLEGDVVKVTPCHTFMLKLLILVSVLFVPALGYSLEVGGIIDTDTVWTLEDSPVIFVGNVQVSSTSVLTINAGVELYGYDFDLEVFGKLYLNGDLSNNVFFRNPIIIPKTDPVINNNPEIYILNSRFESGLVVSNTFHNSTMKLGNLYCSDVKNSHFYKSDVSASEEITVEKNVFLKTRLLISCSGEHPVYVKNNYFENPDSSLGCIQISADEYCETVYPPYPSLPETTCYPLNLTIEHNSFISINGIAVTYKETYTNLEVPNNFWNTTDSQIISSMIYDRNDDLNYDYYIEFEPFLTEPHPDTPTDFNQPPTANAGNDQTAINSAILVGSLSTDPEDDPLTYSWTLSHRANPNFNRTAEGSTPSVCSLEPGFYDVRLTVEDPSGNIDTDTMVLAVASPQGFIWDINGDGKRGLEEVIYILQELSGVWNEEALN